MKQRVHGLYAKTLCAVVVCVFTGMASAAQQQADRGPIEALTAAQQAGLDAFVEAFFPGAKYIVLKVTESGRGLSSRPPVLDVRLEIDGKKASVAIDQEDGSVYSYYLSGQKDNDRGDLISEAEAWDGCKSVFAYLGIEAERSTFDFHFVNDGYGRVVWDIYKEFVYEGMPCRGSRLGMEVGASTGILRNFWYAPPITPLKKPEDVKKISKEEAAKTAREWLQKCLYFHAGNPRVTEDLDQVIEVVAVPNDLLPELTPIPEEDPVVTYYCWEVPFTAVEHGRELPGRLWINVETAEVIGFWGK